MRLFFLSAALALSVLAPSRLSAQCSGGSCRIAAPPTPTLRWYPVETNPNQVALYRGSVQIGNYDAADDYYRPYDAAADSWGDVCPPPVRPPVMRRQTIGQRAGDAIPNFGLETEKMGTAKRYTICDARGCREISRAEAMAEVTADIPDDASLPRLTVIGTAAECGQVLADVAGHPAFAPLKDKLLAKGYRPDHWAVAATGFVTTGHPSIYCQAPDGKVLLRRDDYPGAEAMATAIRRQLPDYDPQKDPNGDGLSLAALLGPLKTVPPAGWLIGSCLALAMLKRKAVL